MYAAFLGHKWWWGGLSPEVTNLFQQNVKNWSESSASCGSARLYGLDRWMPTKYFRQGPPLHLRAEAASLACGKGSCILPPYPSGQLVN